MQFNLILYNFNSIQFTKLQDNTKEKEAVKRAEAAETRARISEDKMNRIAKLASDSADNKIDVSVCYACNVSVCNICKWM